MWCHHGCMPPANPSSAHIRTSGSGLLPTRKVGCPAPYMAVLSGMSLSQPSSPCINVPVSALLWNPRALERACESSIVYLIPQYIIYRHIGWIDTHYPLWVPRVLTPVFATFLLRQFFKTLPLELEEAAKIDGASTFGIYWRIMIPQVKPALAAVGMFTFLESWNDLFGPLIFVNSINLETLPVALALYQGQFFTQTNVLMAAATVTIIPVLLLYVFLQRYFIQGITLTGLKG